MRRFFLFIIIYFVFGCNISNAQAHLSFGYTGVTHADTLYMGDPITFSFWIINQGNSNLSDSVDVLCETFDFSGISISNVQMGSFIASTGSLNVGDSLYVSINGTVSPSSYVIGDNIVVIWPSSITPGITVDTSYTTIHIYSNTTSLLDKKLDEIIIYPNPMIEFSYIRSPFESISSLRVIDILGNIIREEKVQDQHIIYRNQLKSGVYFIELKVKDRIITKRIIIK